MITGVRTKDPRQKEIRESTKELLKLFKNKNLFYCTCPFYHLLFSSCKDNQRKKLETLKDQSKEANKVEPQNKALAMHEQGNYLTGRTIPSNSAALILCHSQEGFHNFYKDNPKTPDVSIFCKISMAYI